MISLNTYIYTNPKREIDNSAKLFGPVVQWIEHHRPKVGVGGSTPSRVTRIQSKIG